MFSQIECARKFFGDIIGSLVFVNYSIPVGVKLKQLLFASHAKIGSRILLYRDLRSLSAIPGELWSHRLIPELYREIMHFQNDREFTKRLRQDQLAAQYDSALIKISIQNFYMQSRRLCSDKINYQLWKINNSYSKEQVTKGRQQQNETSESDSHYLADMR